MLSPVKISVIIPCYQKAEHLKDCLDSVLQQSIESIEIICVNDGSRDATAEILDNYAQRDKRVRVFHQENQGVSAARNRAMQEARGEFLSFMDADDEYPDDETLEYLYMHATKNEVDVAGGGICCYLDGSAKSESYSNDLSGLCFQREEVISYTDYQFDFGFTRFIYKRELILQNAIRFPEIVFFEDPVFFVRVMQLAGSFFASPRYTYTYHLAISERKWNTRTIAHCLHGIMLNLIFSKEKRLAKLHTYSLLRFYDASTFEPMYSLIKEGDTAVLRAFLDLVLHIDKRFCENTELYQHNKGRMRHHDTLIKSIVKRSFFNLCLLRRPWLNSAHAIVLVLRHVLTRMCCAKKS